MHELSLFAQIPFSRHAQVLQILAGIAAMPPQPTLERHIILKPTRPVVRGGGVAVQQQQQQVSGRQVGKGTGGDGELYYLRLVEGMGGVQGREDGKSGDGEEEMERFKGEGKEGKQSGKWTLRFYDVPEPGKRAVVVRQCVSTEVIGGDAVGFVLGMGYRFVQQYIVQGHQVVHKNTVLHLHRLLRLPPEDFAQQAVLPEGGIPDVDDLVPVDESGGYMLQAYVMVQEGSTPDVMARGTAELAQLKDLLKGSIDLRVVDRLALDTRVK